MSVKDVLQSLVDDAMVEQDKIGTSNYFWSFPSKATNQVGFLYRLQKCYRFNELHIL